MRPGRAFRWQFRNFAHVNAVLCQLGQQFVLPQCALRRHQSAHCFLNTIECLRRTQPVRPDLARLAFDLLFDPGHADLEKLIQIRAEDGKELDPLDERLGRILRFLEHATIELKPAQLAIDEITRIEKTICCRSIPPQDLNSGGGLVGGTTLGNGCRHLFPYLNPPVEERPAHGFKELLLEN